MYLRLVEAAVDFFVEHNRADVSKERIRKEAEEMVEFEKKIYEVTIIYDMSKLPIIKKRSFRHFTFSSLS